MTDLRTKIARKLCEQNQDDWRAGKRYWLSQADEIIEILLAAVPDAVIPPAGRPGARQSANFPSCIFCNRPHAEHINGSCPDGGARYEPEALDMGDVWAMLARSYARNNRRDRKPVA